MEQRDKGTEGQRDKEKGTINQLDDVRVALLDNGIMGQYDRGRGTK